MKMAPRTTHIIAGPQHAIGGIIHGTAEVADVVGEQAGVDDRFAEIVASHPATADAGSVVAELTTHDGWTASKIVESAAVVGRIVADDAILDPWTAVQKKKASAVSTVVIQRADSASDREPTEHGLAALAADELHATTEAAGIDHRVCAPVS